MQSVKILYYAYHCLDNETWKQTAKCNIHHHNNCNNVLKYARESVVPKINLTKALFWKLEAKFSTYATSLRRMGSIKKTDLLSWSLNICFQIKTYMHRVLYKQNKLNFIVHCYNIITTACFYFVIWFANKNE